MGKDELKRTGTDQNLKDSQKGENSKTVHVNEHSESLLLNNRFDGSPALQSLRETSKTDELYNSEEHRQIYQSNSKSFNEQRHLYADQAMNVQNNESLVYEAKPTENAELQPVDNPTINDISPKTFHRITEGRSEKGNSESDSTVMSIFKSSDFELANATENYIAKDSSKYAAKADAISIKKERVLKRINSLEENDLEYRNSYKFWKHRLIINKKAGENRLVNSVKHKNIGGKERIHKTVEKTIVGRLKFSSEKIAYTDKQHRHHVLKNNFKADLKRYRLKQGIKKVKNIASESSFTEDELMSDIKGSAKRRLNGLAIYTRRNVRKIKKQFDGHQRLKFEKIRLESLNAKAEMINYKSGIERQKRKVEEAAKQGLLKEQRKRKLKKEMVQQYKREQGNFYQRTKRQHQLKKTVKKEKKIAHKRIKTIVSSAIGIALVFIMIFFTAILIMSIFLNLASESYVNSTSQNDYATMTEASAYFREKEAELEEALKPDNIEPILLTSNPEIFEFIYVLDEISFDANTLVAYLSAKYNEFNLEMVSTDLDELFSLYYTLKIEIKIEEREVYDITQPLDPITGKFPKKIIQVPVCYIILEKTDFFELCKSRIDGEGKKNQMDIFYLTGNGQQVYGPVMVEDWRNKISSNFGWRIHPITGEKKFHNGVDIAVPTGTVLYSPVDGTVIASTYSDTAGNMIVIRNENGWNITYMHMNSRSVQAGTTIKKGQMVGKSGNTGNSTGPHLHLQVDDEEGNPINPIFIIPFSTIDASETF